MTPEQWTLAERLYHEAASIAVADRDSWLARACAGDEDRATGGGVVAGAGCVADWCT